MRYVFVSGSIYDKGGQAMIIGAMTGIRLYDAEAQFSAIVAETEAGYHPYCPMVENLNRADVVLDVGGRCHNSLARRKYIATARQKKIPYIFMPQSFTRGIGNSTFFQGTIPIARGPKSAAIVKKLTGREPVIAADLSFLIVAKEYSGKQYDAGYTTHRKERHRDWDKVRQPNSVQIMWKLGWEPSLLMDMFSGTVEANFGLIKTLKCLYTARYQAACAAMFFKVPFKLMTGGRNQDKYDDLLSFSSLSADELADSARRACAIAAGCEEIEPWK